MKSVVTIFLLIILILPLAISAGWYGTGSNKNTVDVKGYYKKNGKYVAPHKRTRANHYNLDNFNAKNNYNPYTGKYGKKTYRSRYNSYSRR